MAKQRFLAAVVVTAVACFSVLSAAEAPVGAGAVRKCRDEDVNAVIESLKNDECEVVQLQWRKLSVDSLDGIFDAASLPNTNLKDLTLPGSFVGDKGAARLYDVLAACKNLEELELSATKITDLGVIPLAAALRENPPLRKLILDDNGITNEGLRYLLYAVENNTNLVELDLSKNRIDDAGIVIVEEFFERDLNGATRTLKKVKLLNNYISLDAADSAARRSKFLATRVEVHAQNGDERRAAHHRRLAKEANYHRRRLEKAPELHQGFLSDMELRHEKHEHPQGHPLEWDEEHMDKYWKSLGPVLKPYGARVVAALPKPQDWFNADDDQLEAAGIYNKFHRRLLLQEFQKLQELAEQMDADSSEL